MSKKNPFLVVEKILKDIGTVLAWAVIVGALALFGYGGIFYFWNELGWGAWGLTFPLLFITGMFVLAIVVGLIGAVFDEVKRRWITAKYDYEWKKNKNG